MAAAATAATATTAAGAAKQLAAAAAAAGSPSNAGQAQWIHSITTNNSPQLVGVMRYVDARTLNERKFSPFVGSTDNWRHLVAPHASKAL